MIVGKESETPADAVPEMRQAAPADGAAKVPMLEVSRVFGLSDATVTRWMLAYRRARSRACSR